MIFGGIPCAGPASVSGVNSVEELRHQGAARQGDASPRATSPDFSGVADMERPPYLDGMIETSDIGWSGDGNAPDQESQQSARAIDPAELTAAMQFLSMALQAASEYEPSQGGGGRKHVVQALVGVNQLIAALFPNKPVLPVALIDLACALNDLDRGIVAPLLKPADVSHRPPNALSAELFRALPAAAMTLEMEAGKRRKEASREIAAQLNRMGYRDSSGNRIEGSQVAKWREKMMTERAAENLAVARYQLALEKVKGIAPGEAAKFVLANMPALHPPTIPKKPTS